LADVQEKLRTQQEKNGGEATTLDAEEYRFRLEHTETTPAATELYNMIADDPNLSPEDKTALKALAKATITKLTTPAGRKK